MDNFFNKLNLPTISQEDKVQLKGAIILEEIHQAIHNIQSSKAQGPDGFTPGFYKTFIEQLSPLLLEVFNISLHTGYLLPSFYQAHIIFLF